jgi:hypothetical protein
MRRPWRVDPIKSMSGLFAGALHWKQEPGKIWKQGGSAMRIDLKPIGLLIAIFCLGMSFALAGEIRKSATMQVKPNSIWFEDVAKLTHWQQLKKSSESKAVSYQDELLAKRDAWQFIKPLTVKIVSYDSRKKQVNVEMMTPGRMLGTRWVLDADALLP